MPHHAGPRDTVDGGVMHLHEDGDAPIGQSFDHPDLPQGSVAPQGPTGDVTDDVGQRLLVTRGLEHDAMYMAIHVQVRIIDPVRSAQLNGVFASF